MSEPNRIPITFVVAAGQAPPTKEEVDAYFKTSDFDPNVTTYLVTDVGHNGFIRVDEYEYQYEAGEASDE